ncbi:hypothetical protein GCM10009809_39250 [Isoptericola hypogeus]|uniref:Thioredoxin family protein n=1 Tax=Isoptericola hypogeus TaxID=300179 RepID=A0ABP4VW99_9MICO
MKVELLVVDECPNEARARAALDRALDRAGIHAVVSTTVVADDAQALARGFVGSPSFHVDGRDVFPVPTARPGVACRVYSTADGLRGVPDDEALVAALVNHSGR